MITRALRMLTIRKLLALLLLIVSCAGCAPTEEPQGIWGKLWKLEVGPDYKRPPTTVSPEFRSQLGPAEAASFADLSWWNVFNDQMREIRLARHRADGCEFVRFQANRITSVRMSVRKRFEFALWPGRALAEQGQVLQVFLCGHDISLLPFRAG